MKAVGTLMALLCLLVSLLASAQENEQVYIHGKRYVELNLKASEKYSRRLERTQKNLLGRLKRKQHQILKRLKRTDSVAYAKIKSNRLDFDSISRLNRKPDSLRSTKHGSRTMDSLKKIYGFLKGTASKIGADGGKVAEIDGYAKQIDKLSSRLSYDQYISGLTDKYAKDLEQAAGNGMGSVGLQKDIYYARSKIGEWKKIADDPSRAEQAALEYLQGTKGFDQAMGGDNFAAGNANLSVDQLEAMGYQTKRQLTGALQKNFGGNLQSVQGKLAAQLGEWQGKGQQLQGQISETKQSFAQIKATERPKFKINPMKGLPFRMRIEKQYGFNTSRANATGGGRPAMLSVSAAAAYRQTPVLSIGIGIAGDIGLGKDWSNIRLSFEGIGARSFVTWKLQYGIGLYGGFERTWKGYAFGRANDEGGSMPSTSSHSNASYSDAVLLGLTKMYRINSKWNGSVQLLYDFWWREKNLRSPFLLRFVNSK